MKEGGSGLKRFFVTALMALGFTGVLAAAAPIASAEVVCLNVYVRIAGNVLVDNQDICI